MIINQCYRTSLQNNNIYFLREDLLPFSFGGNKSRKAVLFFEEIENGNFDCVVTYGSSSSNHCRIIANMAIQRNMPCYIISPKQSSEPTNNSILMNYLNAQIDFCDIKHVSDTIKAKLSLLKGMGKNPYFIMGGGHGNIGTKAYVDCFNEIKIFEEKNDIYFDYIVHASGTGTTQAGLECGRILKKDYEKKIIGISIARNNPYGKEVILKSMTDYFNSEQIVHDIKNQDVYFIDDYIAGGYGISNERIEKIVRDVFINEGIPLNNTYTGKAFWGMWEYLQHNKICDKNVLFINTGGTPLFFDDIHRKREKTI